MPAHAAKFYRGAPYQHPQENEAFRHLCSAGAAFPASSGDVRIIGNIACNNCPPIDALVLGPCSITIVDFKDYGGTIQVIEDADWRTSKGVTVKGGSYDNPYCQVRGYKLALIRWLETNGLLQDADLDRKSVV